MCGRCTCTVLTPLLITVRLYTPSFFHAVLRNGRQRRGLPLPPQPERKELLSSSSCSSHAQKLPHGAHPSVATGCRFLARCMLLSQLPAALDRSARPARQRRALGVARYQSLCGKRRWRVLIRQGLPRQDDAVGLGPEHAFRGKPSMLCTTDPPFLITSFCSTHTTPSYYVRSTKLS